MTDRRIQMIERVLGLAKGTANDGPVTLIPYEAGYGPARTLLDINFDLAPGYYVYDTKNPPEEGEEPARPGGGIYAQRFVTDKRVLAVPIYLVAEQVAQIMRYLRLPMEFVVELESAKPYDPETDREDGGYKITKGGEWPPKGPRKGNIKAFTSAFEDRAAGTLSLLPQPELENGIERLRQRGNERVTRRTVAEVWPAGEVYGVPAVQMDGVDEGDELQQNLRADMAAQAAASPMELVPQAGEAVLVEERKPKRQREEEVAAPPPQFEVVQPTAADAGQFPFTVVIDPATLALPFEDAEMYPAAGGPPENVRMSWENE